ncbi:cation diffusion facilitator family transporter [Halovenus rubra]|uniref:Cation diffusion facilitator family transporter n=2 Tax=Halovenus rubra TaxID=869890 RepID=A0ABD5X464_9EURY|nr:cation diffusion facilitator family transporter [Halovenus rubra]
MAGGSTGVVIAAMIANGGIAILKFIGFLLTGSPSMLAETYHSISDTGNQVLLLIGIKHSQRGASRVHPFGYGKAQFFFAFLVSVLLFGVAGWESLKHGIAELQAGGHEMEAGEAEFLGFTIDIQLPIEPFWVVVAILLGAVAFETYAFLKARAELKEQMETHGWSGYRETFSRTSDLTTLTAFTEDTVALVGLLVALGGIIATRLTENPVYDSLGAVVIGILLMIFAVFLAIENKRLILGESLPEAAEDSLKDAISGHSTVTGIEDFRSMFIGSGEVLVTADVEFDGSLDTAALDEDIRQIETELQAVDKRVKIVYIEPQN